MSKIISDFQKDQLKLLNSKKSKPIPSFSAGDSVSVKYKISEGKTSRIQIFTGVVIAKTKSRDHYSATATVRKLSGGIGVERKFHLNSPLVTEIEVLKRGKVNRAKIYYIRDLTGKSSRIKEKVDFSSSSS